MRIMQLRLTLFAILAIAVLGLADTVHAQNSAGTAEGKLKQLRVEFLTERDQDPDYVCVVAEVRRQDSSEPKRDAEDGVSSECRSGGRDASLPLSCLVSAKHEKDEGSRTKWVVTSQNVESLKKQTSARPLMRQIIEEMLPAPTSTGDPCEEPSSECRPGFLSSVTTVEIDSEGKPTSGRPLHVTCFQQAGGKTRDAGQVAFIRLDFAQMMKSSIARAKLVDNLVTLELTNAVDERTGIAVSVIGGHYSRTRSAFVTDGQARLTLEPRCSAHQVDAPNFAGSDVELAVTIASGSGDTASSRTCTGRAHSGRVTVWTTRDEEVVSGSVTLVEQYEFGVAQALDASWTKLQPSEGLTGQLRTIAFGLRRGCFLAGAACPKATFDGVVECAEVPTSSQLCAYRCDASTLNMVFRLPAEIHFSLTEDEASVLSGDQGIAYRWRQRLPAAGLAIDEDIADSGGRSLQLDLSGWADQAFVAVDRLVVQTKNPPSEAYLADIGRRAGSKFRVPLPAFSCGNEISIHYEGNRFVLPYTRRTDGQLTVPDPATRTPPLGFRVGLLFAQSTDKFEGTDAWTDGLAARLGFMQQVYPWAPEIPVALNVGGFFGVGVGEVTVVEQARSRSETVPKLVGMPTLGATYELMIGGWIFFGGGNVGFGVTNTVIDGIEPLDSAHFSAHAAVELGMRFHRYVGIGTNFGALFWDPDRSANIDKETVAFEGGEAKLDVMAGLWFFPF